LDFFNDLGTTILRHWGRADFNSRAFPDIAAAALSKRPPSAHVEPMDVIRWVHETVALVPQVGIEFTFGQPPITVFRCEEFYIDVLFWVDGTTSIHQHRFSGAFHVMAGSSLQSRFRFTPERTYSERLLSGKLELLDVELLTQGDVRPIVAGAELVHALFHLDRPSVSVVVRTPGDDLAGPQYSYSRAGLAFDPFAKSESMKRKIQTLDLLHALGDPSFEPLARATVRGADAFLAFKILTHLAKRIEGPERYLSFLESIRPAHDALVKALKVHAEYERREDYIITRRQLAKASEHRFFLALLLNLPDRGHILDVVCRAYPAQPPVDTILRWLSELAKIDTIHAWVAETSGTRVEGASSGILDVPIDEGALEAARRALEGEVASPGDHAVRSSLLLRPLFVP
jgi:hypothetical protein